MNYSFLLSDAISKNYNLGICACVIKDNRILLIKRASEDNYGGIWEMPGGGVEKNEDPKLSLVRELSEEVGLKVTQGDLEFFDYFEFHNIETNKHKRKFCFIVKAISPNIQLSGEHSDYKFFNLEEILKLRNSFNYPDNYEIWNDHYLLVKKVLTKF